MNTMIEIEVFTPLPKPTPLPPVEMPPKKAAKAAKPIAKAKTIEPVYRETEEEPLDISTTEIIKVQPFEHEEIQYYREPIKNKLYKRKANGSVGDYVGRWSPKEQALNEEIPDSDRED
jgi:hypothetical protein